MNSRSLSLRVKTTACFFPFDLFGSSGAKAGAELLADAFREMLVDNRREKLPTRANAYAGQVKIHEFEFGKLEHYENWRERARQKIHRVLAGNELLLWVTGNHLGALPVYEELGDEDQDTLVLQFDAHLDIYNLADCSSELSHGNFLLHSTTKLPRIINIGNREVLLPGNYVKQFYTATYSATELAGSLERTLRDIRKATARTKRILIDIDCDVFDPAYFPAVAHPLPFGISPQTLLQFLTAVWSDRVVGVCISEFDPARDRNDQSLSTLIWLLETLLLMRYEK